jgi:hypothetical protein
VSIANPIWIIEYSWKNYLPQVCETCGIIIMDVKGRAWRENSMAMTSYFPI